MIWESDFNYDEVYGEGDGIVTYLHCPSCGADCKFSRRDDEVDNYRLQHGFVFETAEEAIEAAEKMLAAINEQ